MLLLETETDDFFEQTRGWTPTSISMHVKRETEMHSQMIQSEQTLIQRSPTEVGDSPREEFGAKPNENLRTAQFHWDIMNSMVKVKQRMGGTMGGNDEESLRFVNQITEMHERANEGRRSTKGSNDGQMQVQPRVHFSVISINDFIDKLRFISLTKQALSSNEPNFAGFQDLFKDFYDELKDLFKSQMPSIADAKVNEYVKRVSNYVLRRLHQTVWHADRVKNEDDVAYHQKIQNLQWVTPEYLDLPEVKDTVNWPMWNVCIDELHQMERLKTP